MIEILTALGPAGAALLAVVVGCLVPLLVHTIDVHVAQVGPGTWRCWIRNLEDVPLCVPFQVTISVQSPGGAAPTVHVRSPWDVSAEPAGAPNLFRVDGTVMYPGETWIVDVKCADASEVVAEFRSRLGGTLRDRGRSLILMRKIVARSLGVNKASRRRTLPGAGPVAVVTVMAIVAYWLPFAFLKGPLAASFTWDVDAKDLAVCGGIAGTGLLLYLACRRDVPPRVLDVLDRVGF